MKTEVIKVKLILLFVLCCTQLQAQWWGGKKIAGSGNNTTRIVTTNDYDTIRLQGSMDVHLEQGTEGKIRISTDDNIQEYVEVTVKGNDLVLSIKSGVNLRPKKGIHIYVPFVDLSAISITGSGDVNANTTLKTADFKATITGSGNIKLSVEASEIKGHITGSGNMLLKGSTNSLKVSITGSGDFNSEGLQAQDTDVIISGSGDAKVVALKSLKTKVSGSGDIKYTGSPAHVDSKTSGSGSVSSF